jgi:hypothetical protein
MAAAAAPATSYEYGGAQQGYNPYDAYSQGGASSYHWQPGAAQHQQAQHVTQVPCLLPVCSCCRDGCVHPRCRLSTSPAWWLRLLRFPLIVMQISACHCL